VILGFFDDGSGDFTFGDLVTDLGSFTKDAAEIKGTFGDNNTGAPAPGLPQHPTTSPAAASDGMFGGLTKGVAPVYVVGGILALMAVLYFARK
jgi:hypothetical protein